MSNGYEKGFPPSKSSIANPRLSRSSSTGSVENDENDSSENQMIPKFENHKKMVAKNFMSPTISAAAKAVSPRKKILGEKNENPVISDSQNPEAKKIPQVSVIGQSDQASSLVVSSYNYATESDDNKGDTDSLAKGYDPTNYLIPRPKYLRYNPSRQSEVLNKLVNDAKSFNGVIDYQEGGDGELPSVDDVEHFSFSPNENSVRLEVGENAEKVGEIVSDGCDVEEEEEEEDEDEEEEVKRRRGGWLRGVFKHMVMLIACFMFMSCISPMNSPAPLPAQQSLWNSTDGYLLVTEQALDSMTTKMHDPLSFLGVEEVGDDYGVPEEIKVDEASEDDKDNEEMAKTNGENLEGHSEDETDDGDGVETTEGLGAGEFEFEGGDSFEQMMVIEFDESVEDNTDDSSEIEVEPEAVDAEIVGAGEIKSEYNGFGQLKGYESEDVAKWYALESTEMDSDKVEFQPSEIPKEDDPASQQEEEFKQNLGSESSEELHGLSDEEELTDSGNENDETGYDYKAEMQKLRWSISAVVGVFIGALLLAALAFFYRSAEARSKPKESKAAAVKKPKQKKAAEMERVITTTTTVPPPMERKVEFLARPSLLHPARESSSELNYHRVNVPTVELIGEIVIGGRKKSSTNKFQVNEYFKESHATNPIAKQSSLPQPVSTPIHTSAFEHLPSYGSIAAETKIFKKEEGQSINANTLRRSTRLRR